VAPADGTAGARRTLTRARIDLLRQPMRTRPLRDVAEATTRLTTAHPGLDAERAVFLAEVGTRPGPDGGRVWKFDPRTRHWLVGFDRPATEERWGLVACPVLVITGGLAWDRWWSSLPLAAEGSTAGPDPAEIARRVALFPDVEHVELAQAGHMLAFDQPDALNAAIADFLTRRLPIA
jgi:pimeloyl-ACP methyl ester carboxylesterase